MMDQQVFTDALVAALATATGYPVGNGEPPVDEEMLLPVEAPFYIVYDGVGSAYSGPPFGDAHADAHWTYQVTSVATGVAQAQWLKDLARTAILGRVGDGWAMAIPAAGMSVSTRSYESDGGGDSEGAIVSHVERFSFDVTPSS